MGNVVGIDLGTTFSAIARINGYGFPEIVTVGDDNERMIASILYFSSSGTTFVGRRAIKAFREEKDDTRLVELVKKYMGENILPLVENGQYKGPRLIDGKEWRPSDLSAILLARMKKDFEAQFGPIDQCVISVPAYFDEVRRQATVQAATKAGLPVLGIVNEPTAAALLYAKEFSITGKTLVFDLGGGTFDVTVLNIRQPDVDILASRGDRNLGGSDFDQMILNDSLTRNERNIKLAPFDQILLRWEAEDIKKTLSAKTTVKGQNFGYNYEISRGLFESLIEPYFSKIEMLIEEVIDESKLSFSKIDNIILVGGSSRIPLVTSLIKRLFKKEPIKLGNMDEAVALGAAIHGGIKVASSNENRHLLTPKAIKELSSIRLKDVANHSYGTLAIKFNEEQQKDEQAYFIIIPKNTKLPVQETKRFYTRIENQLEVDISVYQGEDLESPESNRKIYDGVMKVPGNRPKGQPFDITYIYDENQMMKCIFLDVNSGKKEEIDLSLNKQDDDINNSEIDEYLDF